MIRFLPRFGVFGACLLLGISGLLTYLGGKSPRVPPMDAVRGQDGWAAEDACIDCHEQAASFWKTGHAQTLRPATDDMSTRLLAKIAAHSKPNQEGTSIRFTPDTVVAVTDELDRSTQVPLSWCFGSGNHACTWTSTMLDSSGATDQLEFRWTWYHGDTVDVTPGQPIDPTEGYFGKLGVLHDGPKAMRCFGCHADYLPSEDGFIDESRIKPGISCQRCHGPRQAHVDSDGRYTNPAWQPRDRMDAVHRCAQCHRRADELDPSEIDRKNISIVRFQPVGLVQSKCFIGSEMTCTTCHDPHRPVAEQYMRGIWQCVQCHDPLHSEHILCGAGESDGCLDCHMPIVKMDSPLRFTDHWIRVRPSAELAP